MTVVVDASVALKWALHEEYTEEALALWDVWQESAERVIAPPLFRSEVTNVIHRRVRRAELDPNDASDILETLISLVASMEPVGLHARALAVAIALNLSSTYDAMYLALAESQGCEVWTADRRFARAVESQFGQVRWIGELLTG